MVGRLLLLNHETGASTTGGGADAYGQQLRVFSHMTRALGDGLPFNHLTTLHIHEEKATTICFRLTLKDVVGALVESDHQRINIIAVEAQPQQKLVDEMILGTFK